MVIMAIIKVISGILVIIAAFTIPSLWLAIRYLGGKKEDKGKGKETIDEAGKIPKKLLKEIWWGYFKPLAAIPIAWYSYHLIFYLMFPSIARAIWDIHWHYLMTIELVAIALNSIINKDITFEKRTSRKLMVATYVQTFIIAVIIIIFRIGWSETATNINKEMLSMLVNSKTELLVEDTEKLTKAYRAKPTLEKMNELRKKAKKLDRLSNKEKKEFFSEFEEMENWKEKVQKIYTVPDDKKIRRQKLLPQTEPSLTGTFEVPAAAMKNIDGSWRVPVPANRLEVNSTIVAERGQNIVITATGQVNGCKNHYDAAYGWTSPEGRKWGWNKDRKRVLGQNAPFMALCAKIGKDGEWFKVGRKINFTAHQSGKIFFTVNDDIYDASGRFRPDWMEDNEGKFIVNVII